MAGWMRRKKNHNISKVLDLRTKFSTASICFVIELRYNFYAAGLKISKF